jgi:uncharacterized secreted protein with C-terminal beta-propeller domain
MKKEWKAIFVLVILSVIFVGCITPKPYDNSIEIKEIPKFSSCTEIKNVFEKTSRNYGIIYETAVGIGVPTKAVDASEAQTPRYSTTNIQVQGVDEADIVKTDGKYIYVLSNKNLVIAKAFPAEEAEILSKTDLGITPKEIFVHGNNILVFGQTYKEINKRNETKENAKEKAYPYPAKTSITVIQLIDASNKEKPEIKRTIEFEGRYLNSRKIKEQVYFVINSYPNYYLIEKEEEIIPLYADSMKPNQKGFTEIAKCGEIGYLTPINPESFITIASISMDSFDSELNKETVVGSAQNIYASKENLYLAQTEYSYPEPIPLASEIIDAIKSAVTKSKEYTSIHKFSLKEGKINYIGVMQAPGRILNQFSMDEFQGNFRIATTTGHVSRMGGKTSNNIYVFGEDLKIKGKIEDLAPGEKIYSARFMGKKAYLVTFKKVDPLFVIDLSKPEKPKVLGKLKIPGYSDYLHPIDETHLIGVGKETIEAEQGDFAWYQGIKIAVFDVSDVEKPKQMYKEIIGDRGTDSYALRDHKAFLYDKEKNLLVIPVKLAEISEEQKQAYSERENSFPLQGEFTFQGAYVYELSLENGFKFKGRITHEEGDAAKKAGYYYYLRGNAVKRALFIDNVLYTISNNKILANSLEDLSLIKKLVMAEKEETVYREYW